MGEFPSWERLALVSDRPKLSTKSSGVDDFSQFSKSNADIASMRSREATDRAKEIEELPFLTPEEKAALLSDIVPWNNPIILAQNTAGKVANDGNPENITWQEPFVEFAKDMLVPDWTDLALLLATWPEGPVIKRGLKLPLALKKFIAWFEKYLDKAWVKWIERAFETFIQTGNKKGLEESIVLLRKSGVKEKMRLADDIERGIMQAEVKAQEIRKAKALWNEAKTVEKIPQGPKISEMSPEKLQMLEKRSDFHYRRELQDLMKWWGGEKMVPKEQLIQKLDNFEEYIVYSRDVTKLKPSQLLKIEERYMTVFKNLIHQHDKVAPTINSIQDAKLYLQLLKTP